jgi:hypothetical protein
MPMNSSLPALVLLASVAACGNGGPGFRHGITIDPNLPHEDPSNYPENPVVSVPAVVACPYKATNACPDAGMIDSPEAAAAERSEPVDDAPTETSSDASVDEPTAD